MEKAFLLFTSFLFYQASFAQNDFIILKKKDRIVQTIFTGSQVAFTTSLRNYSGSIGSIQNDSLYLLEYDVRRMPTNLGVYILDTVATYRTGIHYKDILKILAQQNGFSLAASGASLLGGGLLITTVGLGTWIFTKKGDQYHASPKLIAGSAILAAAGYVLLKVNGNGYPVGKKYTLNYIATK